MKDKTARALAIVALVFAAVFTAALIATLVDYTLLNNGVGFIALGAGVFVLMIFIALKADGRTYSITKMNNDIEMAKIEKEIAEREAAQGAAEQNKGKTDGDAQPDTSSEDCGRNAAESEIVTESESATRGSGNNKTKNK